MFPGSLAVEGTDAADYATTRRGAYPFIVFGITSCIVASSRVG
jgi:hypothetical protein